MYGISDATQTVFGPAAAAFAEFAKTTPLSAIDAYFHGATHPMSLKLPMMGVYNVTFAILLYFVSLGALYYIGQAVGKLKLKSFGILHNFFLFALSLYMWFAIAVTAIAAGYRLWNNGVDENNEFAWPMAKLVWLFYVSKLPEFVDTVIMMLKHNYRQVSFLHLYHHSTIFAIWFLVVSEGPGGDSYFSAFLNSGVHVVMYGYYFGTMVSSEEGKFRKFLNSIKFMITKGQMTQFALNACQSTYLHFFVEEPLLPLHLSKVLFVYMLTLLALFGNFLLKNQAAARAAKKKAKEAAPLPETTRARSKKE
jgi:elongation of very long chain fatty acids protein 4